MKRIATLVLTALAVFAVPTTPAQGKSFMLVSRGNHLPGNLHAVVSAAGGNVTQLLPQVGIAVVESSADGFPAAVASALGVSVVPDVAWETSLPLNVGDVEVADGGAQPDSHTVIPTDAFYGVQWGLTAIAAPAAWAVGQQGAGVRVAVLDSGITSNHVDIAPRLNTVLSTSFVPGEAYDAVGTGFNHGTHVSGIIAAPANHIGTVGVAPLAELVAVKVLRSSTGSGAFSWIIAGMVYAADIGSDVINLSLGARLPRHGYLSNNGTPANPADDFWVGANEVAALINATSRATAYAYQKGVTIIVAAGNSGIDRDHDADLFVLPADCPHVIAVSATSPYGWADGQPGFDSLASYSNYGQSRISLAAPGGDADYPITALRTIFPITAPAWVFDLVMAPSRRVGASNFYSFASGTSMAAPHVAGVAAIIIGKNGGRMHPAAVAAALRASADDLGKPGQDDAYGAGRVNAGRAAQP